MSIKSFVYQLARGMNKVSKVSHPVDLLIYKGVKKPVFNTVNNLIDSIFNREYTDKGYKLL